MFCPFHFIYKTVIFYTMDWEKLSMPETGSLVAVGMSGGVDSTLVTLLLKEHGCTVVGVTMSSWANDLPLPPSAEGVRGSCYGPDEAIDIVQCKAFCQQLGIEYHVIDVREAYHHHVLDYFKAEYRNGRTPNPCINCNPNVKFGALLDGVRAKGIDFDYFCTGHYATLVRPTEDLRLVYGDEVTGQEAVRPVMISAATDKRKDQTYFLCRVPSATLEKVRFPLSAYTKQEVYAMAQERGLAAASRSESQDFIPDTYLDIIFSDQISQPGDIVDLAGKKLGVHRGIHHYTIGQRRGLGVSSNRPLYVHSIDSQKNQVVLCDDQDLLCSGLVAENWVWAGGYAPKSSFKGQVKIRLASPAASSTIRARGDGSYEIIFDQPQRAVAPGQSAVVYLDGIIFGGGIISREIR